MQLTAVDPTILHDDVAQCEIGLAAPQEIKVKFSTEIPQVEPGERYVAAH
jgi:hypothetical protein